MIGLRDVFSQCVYTNVVIYMRLRTVNDKKEHSLCDSWIWNENNTTEKVSSI